MNYRHAFHAGNFADVLKHVAWLELLRLLTAKDKPLLALDTHAGRGGYDLADDAAQRTGEWRDGIGRLLGARGAPPVVRRLAESVRAYDRKFGTAPAGGLTHYPGSPRRTRQALRPGDRCVLCETHPADSVALRREFAGDRAVEVRPADGYATLKSLLPPPERRAAVLIDPPFEKTDEFDRLGRALAQALKRFATGVYAVWYPVKDEAAVAAFLEGVASVAEKALTLELRVVDPLPGEGLAACGLLVVNPPWTFDAAMAEALPWLARTLGRGPGARGELTWIAGAP
ncbi:MAG: 23S rRNA (adenine(2030)-N(6))-methyltransferase RlmJ [Rhodospirillales bacterium]|nr:MAG: 23S rRNA (adenine(2030)-N(6))-methyltransferase RlmJ [Rhodospirillales bacterium]